MKGFIPLENHAQWLYERHCEESLAAACASPSIADDPQLVVDLVAMGARIDPDMEWKLFWTTPLEWCVEQKKPKMMKTLLDLGATMTCNSPHPTTLCRTNLLVRCYQTSNIQCGILLLDRGYNRMPYYWVHPSWKVEIPVWSKEFLLFRRQTKDGCFALAGALKKRGLNCRNMRRQLMEQLWALRFE